MAALDHLVYVVPDLDVAIARFAETYGVEPAHGGAHEGRGTRNALVGLGDGAYLELISVDPDQPEPERPRPFGVDGSGGPRLVTYAVHAAGDETIDDLAERLRDLGRDPGEISSMSRSTPDGTLLRWRLTAPSTSLDGALPFLIDWGDTEHPSAGAPSGLSLVSLRASTRHPEAVRELVEALGLDLEVADGGHGLHAVVETPDGRRLHL